MSNLILEIKNLEVSFGDNKVVKSINLQIGKGETFALVGESGSGKSVTCSSILGLLPSTATLSGQIFFAGEDISEEVNGKKEKLKKLRGKKIGYIPQNPTSSLNPVKSVFSQLKETVLLHNPELNKNQIVDFCKELLEDVQLYDFEKVFASYPFELSGGMCQRVMIALALAGNPELLLADEPTTALDVTIQAEIMSLLLETTEKRGLTLFLITHDLALVAQTCKRIAVIQHGEIKELGQIKEVFSNPQNDYTKELLQTACLS